MPDLSIIIPSRNCNYLSRTIQDLFEKAKDSIEVIALCDDFWPNPIPKEDPRLTIVHKGAVGGMRDSINRGVELAKGKWIMKTDDHCAFSEGFDVALQSVCDEETLSVPSRYSLDVEKWVPKDRPPVQYNFLTWPYVHDDQFGTGFHGKKWTDGNLGMIAYYGPENRFKDKLIDEIITFQGSCWFMSKQKYLDIDGLDTRYSFFFQEAQELGMKMYMSGGRVCVCKDVWYAHLHKDNAAQSEFHLSYRDKKDAERFHTWFWTQNIWPKRIPNRSFQWLVEKFWPLPQWPNDWEEQITKYYEEHPNTGRNFKIVNPDGHDGLRWKEN